MVIPASLFMQKLGCGTGVNVYLMKRYMLLFSKFEELTEFQSPCAIKKINNKCAKTQQNCCICIMRRDMLHGDIKSYNVVIKGDFETIKFCDVGVSFKLDENMRDDSFDEADFDEDAYYEALGTRLALNMKELDESFQKVIELFSVCTNEDLEMQPSAVQIVEVLEAVMQEPSK
ncbi:UNVERIFIED_CONTAM: hypothetical protein FKN15_051261 [Acipenser sinensis]